MSENDHQKLLDAGFVILCANKYNLTIRQKTPLNRNWRKLKMPINSKAHLARKMKELLTDKMTVED